MAEEHLDVIIIGAGLSGIGAAYHIGKHHPQRRIAVLEAREELGGTWSLFRYPGIRSDSDMHTLGFSFHRWDRPEALADGSSILTYLREAAIAYGIDRKIRYRRRVVRAEWSSAETRWTVDVEDADTGETTQLSCDFLVGCTGYYRYDEGYTPDFEGFDSFEGEIIHPQHWPGDLDYAGRRIVVIGSGATAMTLVPAIAPAAAQVTMLQRSPSYIAILPATDPFVKRLRSLAPSAVAFTIVRWRNVLRQQAVFQLSRRRPQVVKRILRRVVMRELPAGYDVDLHFKPRYDPWDQRLCLVPDGDLFAAIRSGKVEMVTDEIETFTERGIRLRSGTELEAEIIVTATGLNLLMFGGIELAADGERIDVPSAMTYKGMMIEDVPNFAFSLGYSNASWTLKADLTGEYVGRLLAYMDEHGLRSAVAHNDDPTIRQTPVLDLQAGYVLRALDGLPKSGSKPPWRLRMNYPLDLLAIRFGRIDDGVVRFSRGGARAPAESGRLAA